MAGLTEAIESSGLAKLIGKVAPGLGALLGGPAAGIGLAMLANAFGVAGDPEKLASVIGSDPDAVMRLKQLEYNHAESITKLTVTDIQDARQYGAQYGGFMKALAWFVTVGFFAALLLLFVPFKLDPNERELVSMLVGMLVSKWQTIIDFFYGSSQKGTGGRNE